MRALQPFEVEQFVYSGTMLVHEPGRPGERIKEDRPIAPGWAYPKSKAAAENAISESRGDIPVVFLHLAGLYDERTSVPTFANQIARRSEEHTSELQSLMRNSYAVFCLKKQKKNKDIHLNSQ